MERSGMRDPGLRYAPSGLQSLSPLLLVARPGGFVGRIEPGKFCAVLDLVDDPGFEALLLRAFLGHLLAEVRRDHYRAVVVGHDHVVGEYRDAAAAHRLLPADEGKPAARGRRPDAA